MNSYLQECKNRFVKRYGEPSNFDELGHALIKHASIQSNQKVVGLKFDVTGRKNVSNSHNCPINGVENWWREKDLPLGYPGWIGRVWIRLDSSPMSFGSDAFLHSLTYTGTGGAGSYDGPWKQVNAVKKIPIYSWDWLLFESDWPLLKQYMEKIIVTNTLSGKTFDKRFVFQWNDPSVEKSDDNLIAKVLKCNTNLATI